jgi:hypothetical protein
MTICGKSATVFILHSALRTPGCHRGLVQMFFDPAPVVPRRRLRGPRRPAVVQASKRLHINRRQGLGLVAAKVRQTDAPGVGFASAVGVLPWLARVDPVIMVDLVWADGFAVVAVGRRGEQDLGDLLRELRQGYKDYERTGGWPDLRCGGTGIVLTPREYRRRELETMPFAELQSMARALGWQSRKRGNKPYWAAMILESEFPKITQKPNDLA